MVYISESIGVMEFPLDVSTSKVVKPAPMLQ